MTHHAIRRYRVPVEDSQRVLDDRGAGRICQQARTAPFIDHGFQTSCTLRFAGHRLEQHVINMSWQTVGKPERNGLDDGPAVEMRKVAAAMP
jgi:hypothetical protein